MKIAYHLIKTMEEVKELIEKCKQAKVFAYDYETAPLRPYRKVEDFGTKKEANAYYKTRKTLKKPATQCHYSRVCTLSVAFDEENGYVIPISHLDYAHNIPRNQLFSYLSKHIFQNDKVVKIAHNLPFELKFTLQEGILVGKNNADTKHMWIRYNQIMHPEKLEKEILKYAGGLKKTILEEFDHKMLEFADVTAGKHFDELDPEAGDTIKYSGEDAVTCLWLYNKYRKLLEDIKIDQQKCNGWDYGTRPYANYYEYVTKVECDVMRAIAMKEYFGVPFGYGYADMIREAKIQKDEIVKEIEAIGKEHNTNFGIKIKIATNALNDFIFQVLKAPIIFDGVVSEKTGKKGRPSLAKDTLAVLLDVIQYNCSSQEDLDDPESRATCIRQYETGAVIRYPNAAILTKILKKIMKANQLDTLIGSHLEGRMTFVNLEDGRIHASYDMYPRTGRFASSDPNNQNISKQGDYSIRDVYHPEQGYMFICSDYSGQEGLIAALMYKEKVMTQALLDGADLHTITANAVYNLGLDPTKEKAPKVYRDPSKVVLFQIFFGGNKFSIYNKLASMHINKSMEECSDLFDGFHLAYPDIQPFQKSMKNFAYDSGYIESLLGYRRLLPDLHSNNNKEFNKACNQAYNTPIQGTAADMTKQALNNIMDWLLDESHKEDGITLDDVRIVASVHDEIVFEVKKQDDLKKLDYIVKSIVECMERDVLEGMPIHVKAEPEVVDHHDLYNLGERNGWSAKYDYYEWRDKVGNHLKQLKGIEETEVDVF